MKSRAFDPRSKARWRGSIDSGQSMMCDGRRGNRDAVLSSWSLLPSLGIAGGGDAAGLNFMASIGSWLYIVAPK